MTCLSIFLFGQFRTNSIVASFTVTLITVALIINKSVDLLPNVIFKRLEWLGDRSYSIYLYHMPLIYIARYSPVAQLGNVQNHLFYTFLAVVLSILLGALSYSKIESKFRKKASTNHPNHSIGIAIAVTLFLPLALLMTMEVGQKNHYWGLDRNISKPSYAGFLDLKCARDSEKGPPCFYRELEHAKTVLLVGDSHAGQISQAVVDAAKITKWNSVIWTHGGCNVQFRKRVNLQIPDSCIAVNNSMKEWVMENRPDAIIISQFVELGDSIKDLKHALSVLHSLVPNTLIIENVPIFPEDKNFMIQRPIIMLPYQPLKEFDRDVMQLRNQSSSVELVDWARQYGISTMSFESLFCSTTTCKRFKNKKWLYRDSSHLSVAGAEFTIPMLMAYLKKL
jgi:hypothetical protein